MQNNNKRKNNLYLVIAFSIVFALVTVAFGAYSWLFAVLVIAPFIISKMTEEISTNQRKKAPVRVRDNR